MTMKTLQDSLPSEFLEEYRDTPAYKLKDAVVLKEFGSFSEHQVRWPGPQKNVFFWVLIEGGKGIGWNEDPATGWSFPVIKVKPEWIAAITEDLKLPFKKRLLGASSDGRTNSWELTCPVCSKPWKPQTTMLSMVRETCPKCSYCAVVDYNS